MTQNEKLEIGYEILFILLVLQAGPLSQAARREYLSSTDVNEFDHHLRCGTMYLVSVQPESRNASEQNIHAQHYISIQVVRGPWCRSNYGHLF